MQHVDIRGRAEASVLIQAWLKQVAPVWFLRVDKLNALKKREASADCDGVYGFRVITFKKKKKAFLLKEKSFVSNKKANVSVPTGWKSAFICVKGCEGSNSERLQKVVYVGSMAERREWATDSRFQSLCVSLFDQASPGPQEHSFNTSSKRTKQPLSALSLPHPALTQWHAGTNSGRSQPLSSAGGLWSGHWEVH